MDGSTGKQPITLRKLLPLLIILFVAVVGFFGLQEIFSFEALRDNREMLIGWRDNNYLLAVLTYIAIYIAVVAFSLPGAAVMTLTGGFLFGVLAGALFAVLAATLGAIVIFLAAKTGLGDALHEKMHVKAGKGGVLAKIEAGLNENETSYLLLMRLVPVIPFFIANLAPAFLGVKWRNFAWTTFFGIMPGGVVYSSVGAGLGDVFAAGETPDLGIIFELHILGPILGLCALAALPIVIRVIRKDKGTL